MMKSSQNIINIREDPYYNYEHVIEKIQARKITKLARKHHWPNGVYKLRKLYSDTHGKITDVEIEIKGSVKVLWITLKNPEAKSILGATSPPLFGSYLNDLRRYLQTHDMAYQMSAYVWIIDFEYVSKPIQTKLI